MLVFLISYNKISSKLQELLLTLVDGLNSNDVEKQYDATTRFRKLLSKEQGPPIEAVIRVGAVPKFVEFLQSRHELLQVRTKNKFNLLSAAKFLHKAYTLV